MTATIHPIILAALMPCSKEVNLTLLLPDIDECSEEAALCTAAYRECVNTPGSHLCLCVSGYEEQDGECVPTAVSGKTCTLLLWRYRDNLVAM